MNIQADRRGMKAFSRFIAHQPRRLLSWVVRRRAEVGTMTERVAYYKPSCGTKLVMKVMQRGANMCAQLAYSLFQIASRECPQPGLEGEPFRPNWVYEFANGLVFRLFDDGLGAEGHVLEFYVPKENQFRTTEVLARIPRLLRATGVGEEAIRGIQSLFRPPPA